MARRPRLPLAPALDAHTRAVLRDVGYAAAESTRLRSTGVVRVL